MKYRLKMQDKAENFWLNIGFNIVAPSLLLIKGKALLAHVMPDFASVADADFWIFVAAILFPLAYGVYDFASRRKWNIFSVIGFISVLLTGGVGLLSLSREWMIVKEGSVPLVLGLAVLLTAYTRRPLAKMLILNDSVFDVKRLEAAIESRGTQGLFESKMRKTTYIIAASFLLSSALNFALASYIFRSPAGTAEFNEELGTMTALSFPVIALPTMVVFIAAMMYFFKALDAISGLKFEEIVRQK